MRNSQINLPTIFIDYRKLVMSNCRIELDKNLEFNNLVDLVEYRANNQPHKIAYIFLVDGEKQVESLTYSELSLRVKTIAGFLQKNKDEGVRALLLYPSGLDFIVSFLACLYSKIVPIPAYPPRANKNASRLLSIIKDSEPSLILTTESLVSRIEKSFVKNASSSLDWITTDKISKEQSSTWIKPCINGKALAFLQYTSGSTGRAKGVKVSHRNILHNERIIKEAFGHDSNTVLVGWLPFFHDMGLIGNILQPLYLGIKSILMSPVSFLQKPSRWLQAISKYKATTSGGPNFAFDLCCERIDYELRASLDLSSWNIAFNGSETVRAATIEKFTEKFSPYGFRKQSFYPCYGIAESTLFVTGGVKGELPAVSQVEAEVLTMNKISHIAKPNKNAKSIVGCGQNWLDQKVVIVNPETLEKCDNNEVGEIWTAGNSIALGYWNKPDETKKIFQAYTKCEQGPFLRTGDLGFYDNNELFVTGRLKDVIIIRGKNYYPQDIEFTVDNCHIALRNNLSAAFSIDVSGEERLIIVSEVERKYLRKLDVHHHIVKKVRQAVSAEHNLRVFSLALIKTASIPKTSSGKIRRSACRLDFLSSQLDVVYQWNRDT